MPNLASRSAEYGRVVSSESFTQDAVTPTSLTVPAAARAALVTVGANPVRFRSDGSSPTTSIGHYVAANGNLEVFSDEMKSIEFIATTSTSDVFVTYYGL